MRCWCGPGVVSEPSPFRATAACRRALRAAVAALRQDGQRQPRAYRYSDPACGAPVISSGSGDLPDTAPVQPIATSVTSSPNTTYTAPTGCPSDGAVTSAHRG